MEKVIILELLIYVLWKHPYMSHSIEIRKGLKIFIKMLTWKMRIQGLLVYSFWHDC